MSVQHPGSHVFGLAIDKCHIIDEQCHILTSLKTLIQIKLDLTIGCC